MSHTHRFAVIALLAGALLALLSFGPAGGTAGAAPAEDSWSFDIGEPIDVPREGVQERMLGFLLDVDADGRPALEKVWRVRGTPPGFHPFADTARIYRWELQDRTGAVLEHGRHLDKLAFYVPHPDGGCDRGLVGAHQIMVRVPDAPGAERLVMAIESVQGIEEGR